MLCAKAVAKIFPYHVLLDSDLTIKSVGKDLPRILGVEKADLIGNFADSVFNFLEPRVTRWSKKRLFGLEHEDIMLEPFLPSPVVTGRLVFKGSLVVASRKIGECLLILTPDENALRELDLPTPRYGLTVSSSAAAATTGATNISSTSFGCTSRRNSSCSTAGDTEAVSLSPSTDSYKSSEEIDTLTTALKKEQALLESLMPKHAAEGLRNGHNVKPVFHENVTMFFSDIVGFTKMCDKIYPWEIIGVLNRLYCIMDHLAKKFGLFKIETIGDAYVCAAGLPTDDPDHAEKVATFALAVSHCARHVLSPVDGKPLQLRVGIHTGSCASGVVGVTNPRYCVFGDTVNITSRHESTGEADRVHTSESTMLELLERIDKFVLTERGKVDMKGKGNVTTYWLTASNENPHVNQEGLAALDVEVKNVLYNADFGTKERRSSEQMENFSPRKMQKVALSLDKLAMDVLRRSTKVDGTIECSVSVLDESDACSSVPPQQRQRTTSLSLEDLDDETTFPEATDQVYDALATMVNSFNQRSRESLKLEIANALSSSFQDFDLSSNALVELEDDEDS